MEQSIKQSMEAIFRDNTRGLDIILGEWAKRILNLKENTCHEDIPYRYPTPIEREMEEDHKINLNTLIQFFLISLDIFINSENQQGNALGNVIGNLFKHVKKIQCKIDKIKTDLVGVTVRYKDYRYIKHEERHAQLKSLLLKKSELEEQHTKLKSLLLKSKIQLVKQVGLFMNQESPNINYRFFSENL